MGFKGWLYSSRKAFLEAVVEPGNSQLYLPPMPLAIQDPSGLNKATEVSAMPWPCLP